ncbi:MAG: hypothetical protein C5S49_08055 [Candidatus Methanogaster sp.]|nr:MAG: hypothetical protein C5S49_08055 [ANME-2 cluster archaeon]
MVCALQCNSITTNSAIRVAKSKSEWDIEIGKITQIIFAWLRCSYHPYHQRQKCLRSPTARRKG